MSWWNGKSFGTVQFRKTYGTKKDAEAVAYIDVAEYIHPTKGVTDEDTGVYYIPRRRGYAAEIVEVKD